MLQPQRLCSSWGVKRVTGLATGSQPDRQERQIRGKLLRQEREHLLIPLPPGATVAPTQPQGIAGLRLEPRQTLPEPMIALRANRIAATAQHGGAGRTATKQIHHLQAPKPPALGKTTQAAQGGVIALRIRPRWVQHDEQQTRPGQIPGAMERPAVEAAGAKQRPKAGVRQSDRNHLR